MRANGLVFHSELRTFSKVKPLRNRHAHESNDRFKLLCPSSVPYHVFFSSLQLCLKLFVESFVVNNLGLTGIKFLDQVKILIDSRTPVHFSNKKLLLKLSNLVS